MTNKTTFYNNCPRTRAEFVKEFNTNRDFKYDAKELGFKVIGENVIFPNGKIANGNVK